MLGNIYVDFIAIVAEICKVDIQLVIVPPESPLEKKLIEMTRNINGTFPMLEFEQGTLMCDSLAIAAFLIRATGDESLLGSDLEE